MHSHVGNTMSHANLSSIIWDYYTEVRILVIEPWNLTSFLHMSGCHCEPSAN